MWRQERRSVLGRYLGVGGGRWCIGGGRWGLVGVGGGRWGLDMGRLG